MTIPVSAIINRNTTLIIFVFSLILALGTQTAYAQEKRYFDIGASTVAEALKVFAIETDSEILFTTEIVKDKNTQGVRGEYTRREALEMILVDTGLSAEQSDDNLYMIRALSGQGNSASRGSNVQGGAEKKPTTVRRMEEILVTAQKRGEQSLLKVPISMAVLGGDQLDSGRFESVNEAINQIAGVSLDSGLQGGGATISIRGVSPNGPLFKGSATVGYYLDEIPYGLIRSAVTPNPSAFDMERIEVLRGPQGTLYGASALNGVVRLVTRDARLDEFEFKARAAFSNTNEGGENTLGDMSLSVPLIPGKLAARLVLSEQNLDGWIDKPNLNEEDANNANLSSQRLKINAVPTDKLAIELTVSRSRNDLDAPALSRDDITNTAVIAEPVSTDLDSAGLIIEYDFDNFSLLSATSYLDYNNVGVLDVIEILELITNPSGKVMSQEFRLNSDLDGTWQWSVGASYRDAEEGLLQEFPGVWSQPLNFLDESKSSAIFGELTKTFYGGEYEFTLGLRHFEDDVSYNDITPFNTNTELFSSESAFSATTPRAVLTWYPSDDLTAYASYSQGFRSGFEQNALVKQDAPGLPELGEDLLTNYEVGSKGNLWNGRLSYDVALYYINWEDTQQSVGVPIGGGVSVVAPVNAESMSGAGIDIGINAQLTQRLQLGLAFGQNDLTFDDDLFSNGVAVFEDGERGNASPETTAGLTLGYIFPFGANGYQGRFSGSVNYQSERIVKDEGSAGVGVVSALVGDSLTQAHLSFAIDSPDNWTFTAYVDNATNEDGKVLNQDPLGFLNWSSRLRPRTVGLQLEYEY